MAPATTEEPYVCEASKTAETSHNYQRTTESNTRRGTLHAANVTEQLQKNDLSNIPGPDVDDTKRAATSHGLYPD